MSFPDTNITTPAAPIRSSVLERARGQARPRILLVLVVCAISLVAHFGYLNNPPKPVSDEKAYLKDARNYAKLLEQGEWNSIITYRGHYEHPPLMRILWGGGIALARAAGLALPEYLVTRTISVVQGLLLVILITLVNPWAGLFLGVHSIETLFTTRAYLEALPSFTAALAVVSYVHYRKVQRPRWFYLTALALGATAASKYIYLTAGIALAPFILWDHRRQLPMLGLFGFVVAGTFMLLNPHMWTSPIEHLTGSIQFHLSFAGSSYVQQANREWWYPFAYLAAGQGQRNPEWGLSFNVVVFVLGWLGLPRLYRVNRIYFAWFVCSLLFLVIWRTKWNQYSLILIPPLCLSAGFFMSAIVRWLRDRFARKRTIAAMGINPR